MKMSRIIVFAAGLFLFFTSCRQQKSPPGKPVNLRTEYLKNPVGLDNALPRFSWEVNDTSRGASQSAYRILVASSRESLNKNEGDIWDSGEIQSDESNLVPYAGSDLISRQICYWKVMTFDQDGQSSPFSDEASFEMGLLNNND